EFTEKSPQHFCGIQILHGNLASPLRMLLVLSGNDLNGRDRLINCLHSEKPAPAGKMVAEASILQNNRPPASQVCRAAVTEPATVHRNENVLTNTKLTAGRADIVAERVERQRNLMGIPDPPAGMLQLICRNIFSRDSHFKRSYNPAREFDKLIEFDIFLPIYRAVEIDWLV